MKKINKYIIFLIPLLIIIFGFFLYNYNMDNIEEFRPNLIIQGDIESPLTNNELNKLDKHEINYENTSLNVYNLSEIMKKAEPVSNDYDIVYTGTDGLKARISGKNINNSYLNFSKTNGWEVINKNHPSSSNVKLLESITVVSNDKNINDVVTIINSDKNIMKKTHGDLLSGTYKNLSVFEGASVKKIDKQKNEVEVFTTKKVIRIDDYIENENSKRTLIYNNKGEILKDNNGYIEFDNKAINYINPEKNIEFKNIKGVVLNAPVKSNKDAFYDSIYYLENNQKVLVILLDGFGYHQYQYCLENGITPYLGSLSKANKVLTSFKPVTNTGLAAILTGKDPAQNGVYNRDFKDLKTEDIFMKAKKLNKKSVYIEGNIKILNTTIEPNLNPDINKNDSTDDEVYNETIKQLDSNFDLIFAHFHGIDDAGHSYGPYGKKTIEVIKQTDQYLKEISSNWNGKIIITSDHGMHQVENYGDHGSLLYQDMFVPYLITEGGLTNE